MSRINAFSELATHVSITCQTLGTELWVQIFTLPLTDSVALGKLYISSLDFSVLIYRMGPGLFVLPSPFSHTMLRWKISGLESWFYHLLFKCYWANTQATLCLHLLKKKKKANYTLTPSDYHKVHLDFKDVKM